jgi:hypothetical protein
MPGFPGVPTGFALDLWHSEASLWVESKRAGENKFSLAKSRRLKRIGLFD